MRIKCPECQTNYNIKIKPEEISENGSKVSCKKCNHQFFVKKKQKETFKSLMSDIKNKLDDWDKSFNNNELKSNQNSTNNENQQQGVEKSSEISDQEVEDLLKEVLDDEESERQALQLTKESSSTPETESITEGSDQEDIDKLLAEAKSQQQEETLQSPPEASAQEQSSPPAEQTASTAKSEKAPGMGAQEDIDKLFEEAVSQQQEGTLEDPPPEASAQEQSSPPVEQTASTAKSEKAPGTGAQEDIDKLFAEAVSQQQEGTLEDPPPEASAQEQSSPSVAVSSAKAEPEPGATEQKDINKLISEAVSQQQEGTLKNDKGQGDIDDLWTSALEETSNGSSQSDSSESEKKKTDESYSSIDSDQFQNDLDSVLAGAKESSETSLEEGDKKEEEESAVPATVLSDESQDKVDESSPTTAIESPVETKPGSESSDSEISPEELEEESYDEILPESKKGSFKEKVLFYKGLVLLFFKDRKKIVKILVPACMVLFVMSGGGYWYFNKSRDSKITIASVADKEVSTLVKEVKDAKITKKVEESLQNLPETSALVKEGKLSNQDSEPVEKKEKEAQKKETTKKVIPGATLPDSKGDIRIISIGSIVPVIYSPNETKVMSANIKLVIDNPEVYEQVKKGFPLFEDKVESIIEKYFEKKFYEEISFVQEKLREELQKQLNQEIVGGGVKTVELEDFLIQ